MCELIFFVFLLFYYAIILNFDRCYWQKRKKIYLKEDLIFTGFHALLNFWLFLHPEFMKIMEVGRFHLFLARGLESVIALALGELTLGFIITSSTGVVFRGHSFFQAYLMGNAIITILFRGCRSQSNDSVDLWAFI